MPDWFRRRHAPPGVANDSQSTGVPDVPAGVFTKCEKCGRILLAKDFERDLKVCPRCDHHHKLSADERIAHVADPGSFQEMDAGLSSADPLGFPDYAAKAAKGVSVSGRPDALVTGTAGIGGYACVLGVADFRFMGGSMGSVFGEKFARAAEYALDQKIPFVVFCASGGARMQEGLLGLMQMAKTSAAVAQLAEAGVPYVSVLTDPTTGGALASFASLGDIILAEPEAYVAFAGTRVAQQAQTHKPPANYQTSEFQMEHGMVDRIVPRKELQTTLVRVLAFFGAPQQSSPLAQAAAAANGNGEMGEPAKSVGRNGKGPH